MTYYFLLVSADKMSGRSYFFLSYMFIYIHRQPDGRTQYEAATYEYGFSYEYKMILSCNKIQCIKKIIICLSSSEHLINVDNVVLR